MHPNPNNFSSDNEVDPRVAFAKECMSVDYQDLELAKKAEEAVVNSLGMKGFCICDKTIRFHGYSGGASLYGLHGRVTMLVNGVYHDYTKININLNSYLTKLSHCANEWADMATTGIDWIKNIKDNISTPDEALANMNQLLEHCKNVSQDSKSAESKVMMDIIKS